MKKIDKRCTLSTEYQQWEANLPTPHPTYNSSKNKYYTDIVMQLLHCQHGVCAFTEELLCAEKDYDASNWKDGRYPLPKAEFMAELDHFDATKKTNEAWSWDNFLVVSTHINQKVKGSKMVDSILKPDDKNYDEFQLLDYNTKANLFTPNPALSIKDQERVQYMIETLGLNYGGIVSKRSDFVEQEFIVDDAKKNNFLLQDILVVQQGF